MQISRVTHLLRHPVTIAAYVPGTYWGCVNPSLNDFGRLPASGLRDNTSDLANDAKNHSVLR